MNKPWIAASALVLLASPGAYAAGVGKGDFEAGLSVSLTSTSVEIDGVAQGDSDAGVIEVSGGMFFTDQLEAKVALSAVVTADFTAGTLRPGVDYFFTSGSVVPFAGAALGLGVFDSETDYIDVHGGVKYFFRERTSLEARLSFQNPTDSAYDAVTDLFVGLNVYF